MKVKDSNPSKPNILDTIKLSKALRIANQKSKDGQLEVAKNIYEDILQKFSKNKEARSELHLLNGGAAVESQDPPLEQSKPIISLYNQGQLQQALSESNQLMERFPNSVVLYNIAGASNAGLMQFDAAIDSYKKALKINPDYAQAYNNMGNALYDKGDLEESIESYKQALKINPDYADAYNNMGNALKDKGDLEASVESFKQALKINPDFAQAYYNMGNALNDKGDLEATIERFKQALKINPDYADAYNNMGIALNDKGDVESAIESYKQALKINPDYADAYYNMGNALKDNGDPEVAIESYKQALKIKPDFADAYHNMGNAQNDKGDLEASIDSFKQALKIKPDFQLSTAQKIYEQAKICDWAGIKEDRHLFQRLGTLTQHIPPLTMLALEDAPERHRLRSEVFSKSKCSQKRLPLVSKPLKKPKCLRIGYFSSDFKKHPVAYLMAKVLEMHDRTCFEVYGYSIGPFENDDMRQRLLKAFDVFIDVHDMSDQDIALMARKDKIDIAIDLTGNTNKYRLGIFAHRVAPIQINYLGYPGTMGADFFDYIIADKTIIPEDQKNNYSENIIYLPNCYMATDNTLLISDDTPSRLELGLPEKGFIFCCLNNSYKISPSEFNIWMRLLGNLDGSVLWLFESNKCVKGNLIKEAQIRGISADRLVFTQKLPHEKYLAQFRQADLFLDTFNYNAGATASNALWAGLPVITKLGQGYTSRMAGSLLTAIDLPELITETVEDYEALILDLATNHERLAAIKQKLAENRLSKPLFDTELFTKHLEDGYQQVYQRYYDGKLPKAIVVPS